jgi:hypothetical protein
LKKLCGSKPPFGKTTCLSKKARIHRQRKN